MPDGMSIYVSLETDRPQTEHPQVPAGRQTCPRLYHALPASRDRF